VQGDSLQDLTGRAHRLRGQLNLLSNHDVGSELGVDLGIVQAYCGNIGGLGRGVTAAPD
jgi:hypothetical protein